MVRARSLSVAALSPCWARRSLSHAAGTPAGTNIQNTAQVSYTVGASTVTATSNTSSVTVAEILNAVLTIANATVQVSPGATAEELVFTLTNTGNGTETFNLTALSAGVVGDDFDPTLASPAIYFDTDNSGDFSGGDLAYNPGVNDPALAADASVRLIVVNNIPNTASTAIAVAASSLLRRRPAPARRAPASAWWVTAASRQLPARRGGDALLFGEYLVADVQLTAVKSQTIVDQFGGGRPLPGARINYQIVVTPSGTGTAAAAAFNDLIPANTTYFAGSLRAERRGALGHRRRRRRRHSFPHPHPKCGSPSAISRRLRAADDRVRRDHQLSRDDQEKGR